jgi:hypothetical protein
MFSLQRLLINAEVTHLHSLTLALPLASILMRSIPNESIFQNDPREDLTAHTRTGTYYETGGRSGSGRPGAGWSKYRGRKAQGISDTHLQLAWQFPKALKGMEPRRDNIYKGEWQADARHGKGIKSHLYEIVQRVLAFLRIRVEFVTGLHRWINFNLGRRLLQLRRLNCKYLPLKMLH